MSTTTKQIATNWQIIIISTLRHAKKDQPRLRSSVSNFTKTYSFLGPEIFGTNFLSPNTKHLEQPFFTDIFKD